MVERDPAIVRNSLGRNLTHGMVDALGRAIVTGTFDRERFPTEAELAAQYGVSRSVTREAVKMLTGKGLLSARPRQGTVIEPASTWNLFDSDVLVWLLDRKPSLDLLRHFSELRLGIEPVAARLVAGSASPSQMDAIRNGHARMVAAEAGEDDPLEADIAFHVAILRSSENPFLMQFEELVSTALRFSIKFTNRIKGRSADVHAHGSVLRAIEAHNASTAFEAMTAIIADVLSLISGELRDDVSARVNGNMDG